METKRLFVGGLSSDIKEEDLRARFASFGTVSSVEIVRRADDEGRSLKTFAFLNIKQTETDFRRCTSILSGTRWKGCYLKIQAAKESFLSRLSRERQEENQAKLECQHNVEDKIQGKEEEAINVIPETLPKAVPGTPIPGYKNWVVGKFARVLPVVYLRRKDGKKVAKFDPSKTTHCLKRLKTEEMQESAVSELTWSLGSAVPISSGVASKSKANSKREGDGTRANGKIDVVQDEANKSSEGRLEKHDNNYSSESSGWDSDSSSLDGEVNGGRAGNKNLVKGSSCNLEGQIPIKVDKGNTTRSPNLSKTSPVPATQSKVLQNEGKLLSGSIELNGSKHKIHRNGVPRKLPKSTCEASNGFDNKNVVSSSDSSDESTDEKAKSRKIEGKPNAIELKGSNRKKQTNGVPRKLPKSTCEASNGVDEKNVASSSDSSDESTDEKAKSRKNIGKSNAIELKGSKRLEHTNGDPRKLSKGTGEFGAGVDKKTVSNSRRKETESSESSDESMDGNLSEEESASSRNIGLNNGDMPGSESHSDWTKAERGISQSGDKKSARKSFSENLTVDSKESKMLSQLLGDKMKQKLSNDKRLDALMEKRKSVAAHKDIIKDALKDLDSSKRRHGGKKHIVFDDDDNEDDVEDGNRDPVRREKISGSQASSWLGLDNCSDDEDAQLTEDFDVNLVIEKPHFEGKAGERLFKLQRRFGGDKRFDLNERFLESDDENEVAEDDNHLNAKNNLVESKDSSGKHEEEEEHTIINLRQEKEMERKVLGSILGEDLSLGFGEKEFGEENSRFRSSETVRYDPTREDHKQFEQEKKEPEKKKKKETKKEEKQQEQEELVLPKVSQERYHSVESTSLADRFGNKNQVSGPLFLIT